MSELDALPEAATILHPDDVLLVKMSRDIPLDQIDRLRTMLGGSPNRIVVFADDVELIVIPGAAGDGEPV